MIVHTIMSDDRDLTLSDVFKDDVIECGRIRWLDDHLLRAQQHSFNSSTASQLNTSSMVSPAAMVFNANSSRRRYYELMPGDVAFRSGVHVYVTMSNRAAADAVLSSTLTNFGFVEFMQEPLYDKPKMYLFIDHLKADQEAEERVSPRFASTSVVGRYDAGPSMLF